MLVCVFSGGGDRYQTFTYGGWKGGGKEIRETKFLTMKIVESDGVKSQQKYF